MKKGNSLSMCEYMFAHVYTSITLVFLYDATLFKPILKLTLLQSHLLLWGAVAVTAIVGIVACHQHHRKFTTVLLNLLLGLELYTLLITWYYNFFPILLILAISLTTICMLGYFVAAIDQTWTGTFWCQLLRVSHTIAIYGLLLVCIPFGVKHFELNTNVFDFSYIFEPASTTSGAAQTTHSEENTMAYNRDTIALLEESIWATLTVAEKTAVLQTVANIEVNYLGLPYQLPVSAITMDDPNTNGYYQDCTRSIFINVSRIEGEGGSTSYDCVRTVCHEVYHSYQHAQIRLYNKLSDEDKQLLMFFPVSLYEDEQGADYHDGSDGDFEAYYNQDFENAARNYAEKSWPEYYEAVQWYWAEKSAAEQQ